MNMKDNGFNLRNFISENRVGKVSNNADMTEAMGEKIEWMQTAIEDYLDDEAFKDELIKALSNDQAEDIFAYIMKNHDITPREEYPESEDMPGFEGTKDALSGLGIREEEDLEESLNEAGYINDIEDLCYALGYDNCLQFFADNQGAVTSVIDWVDTVPEFSKMLRDFERNL